MLTTQLTILRNSKDTSLILDGTDQKVFSVHIDGKILCPMSIGSPNMN